MSVKHHLRRTKLYAFIILGIMLGMLLSTVINNIAFTMHESPPSDESSPPMMTFTNNNSHSHHHSIHHHNIHTHTHAPTPIILGPGPQPPQPPPQPPQPPPPFVDSDSSSGTLFQSILDSIESPPNRVPPQLSNTSADFASVKAQRKGFYGGDGVDPLHLGGFLANDSNSFETQLWRWAIDTLDIRSVLDVGCGMGYSTQFFLEHPRIRRVRCIEGSSDAVARAIIPPALITQHDYTRGPFWTHQSFDMLWSVEFLEHVEEAFMANYMATFKKAKLLFVTHSLLGGWNHVNVRPKDYWLAVFRSYGFIFLGNLTRQARVNCPRHKEQLQYSYHNQLKANGDRKYPYFHYTGLVFLNPLYMHSFDRRHLSIQPLLQQSERERERAEENGTNTIDHVRYRLTHMPNVTAFDDLLQRSLFRMG